MSMKNDSCVYVYSTFICDVSCLWSVGATIDGSEWIEDLAFKTTPLFQQRKVWNLENLGFNKILS